MFERKSVHMCLFLVKNDYLPFMLKRLMVSYYTSITRYYYGTHSNFVFIHYSCNTLGHVRGKICQLMTKEYALSTGNLPLGGLPRNSVASIADSPDMTSAVDCGCKAPTQPTNDLQKANYNTTIHCQHGWVS